MLVESNLSLLAVAIVALAAGAALGFVLRGRSGAALRTRAEQLESELGQTREEFDAHRDDVARHFQETSELFRDVTEQYSRLYTHLASGARSFSTDGVPALGELETPLLASAPTAEPAAEATPEADATVPETVSADGDAEPAPAEEPVAAEVASSSREPAAPRTNGGIATPPPPA